MSDPARHLVFISYSHVDVEWRDRLRVMLKPYVRKRQVELWADDYIRDGDRWYRDIRSALKHASVAVLLVSPEFLASDFIMEEEVPPLLAAADEGLLSLFCIPIRFSSYEATQLAERQFSSSPRQPLGSLDESDWTRKLVEISRRIAATAASAAARSTTVPLALEPCDTESLTTAAPFRHAGQIHGAPRQRPHYVARREVLERLKAVLLLPDGTSVGVTGEAAQVGLHGQGGIGKTVLVRALIEEPEVRAAFPDGILWISLGQTPDPVELQAWLLDALNPHDHPAVESMREGRDLLRRALRGKRCLLVLDDLWRLQDAQAFEVLGAGSRYLLTTRDAELVTALGAREESLNVLDEDLALEILSQWSGTAEVGSLPDVARVVARECGYLPLALSLAGAQVRDGVPWASVRAALEQGNLRFLDHPYGSVFSSIQASVAALGPDQAARYRELAVFPEDVAIPHEVVLDLWRQSGDLPALEAEKLLGGLARKGLVYQSEAGTVLHDLHYDYLRLTATDLPRLHSVLVTAIAGTLDDEESVDLLCTRLDADDSHYYWSYLVSHLVQAQRRAECKVLMLSPGWVVGKLTRSGPHALIADCELLRGDETITTLARVLRLAGHVLKNDPTQLPGQLLARLSGRHRRALASLMQPAPQLRIGAWLRPRIATLKGPGHEQQTLTGHRAGVRSVAVTPHGDRVVSGAADGSIKVWDLESGEEIRTVAPGVEMPPAPMPFGPLQSAALVLMPRVDAPVPEGVLTLAVSPDGHRIATAIGNGEILVHDLESGALLDRLEPSKPATALAFVGTEKLVTIGFTRQMEVWDIARGTRLASVPIVDDAENDPTTGIPFAAAIGMPMLPMFGPGGSAAFIVDLVAGTQGDLFARQHDGAIVELDANTGKVLRTLRSPPAQMDPFAWFSASFMFGWNLAGGSRLALMEGSRRLVSASDGGLLVIDLASDEQKMVRLPSTATTRSPMLMAMGPAITALAALSDTDRVLIGAADGALRIVDLSLMEEVSVLRGHSSPITCLEVLSDDYRAVSGSTDGTLKIWDLEKGDNTEAVLETHQSAMPFSFLPGMRILPRIAASTRVPNALVSQGFGNLDLMGVTSGRRLKTLRSFDPARDPFLSVTLMPTKWIISQDGRRAVSSSPDGALRTWDLNARHEIGSIESSAGVEQPGTQVSAVGVSDDFSGAAVGFSNGSVWVCDLDELVVSARMRLHRGAVTAIALCPDANLAASGDEDNGVKLWALDSGEVLWETRVPGAVTNSSAMASFMQFFSPMVGVIDLLFVEGSTRLASSCADGTITLWDTDTGMELWSATHSMLHFPEALLNDKQLPEEAMRVAAGMFEMVPVRPVLGLRASGRIPELVSCDAFGGVKTWDLISGSAVAGLPPVVEPGSIAGVSRAVLSRDGRLIVVLLKSGSLEVFATPDGVRVASIDVTTVLDEGEGANILVSPSVDGIAHNLLLSNGRTDAFLFDTGAPGSGPVALPPHRTKWAFGTELMPPIGLDVLTDGLRVVSTSIVGVIKQWSLETGALLATTNISRPTDGALNGPAAPITPQRIVKAACADVAVLQLSDQSLEAWDIDRLERLGRYPKELREPGVIALSPQGEMCLVTSNNTVYRWIPKDDVTVELVVLGSPEPCEDFAEGSTGAVTSLLALPAGDRAVVGRSAGALELWNARTDVNLRRTALHDAAVNRLAITPDRRRLLAASEDGRLSVLDIGTWRVLHRIDAHDGRIDDMLVTGDGLFMVTVSGSDRAVRAWDIRTGTRLAAFTADAGLVAVTEGAEHTILAADVLGGYHLLELLCLGAIFS